MLIQRQSCKTRSQTNGNRRGVAVVEAALISLTFFLLIMVIMDYSLLTLSRTSLTNAARDIGREAVVRGEMSSPTFVPWGPESWSGTADANHPIAIAARKRLTFLEPENISIQVEWLSGSNDLDEPVQIILQTDYTSLVSGFFNQTDWEIEARTTVRILH